MGRPTKYTDAILKEICDRLSSGEPLAQICRSEGMPAARTVREWQETKPDVSAAIARAREEGEDAIAAEVLKIIDSPPDRIITKFGECIDPGDVSNRKLRAEYRLKLLAKWNPKRWGEKVDLTSGGEKLSVPAINLAQG